MGAPGIQAFGGEVSWSWSQASKEGCCQAGSDISGAQRRTSGNWDSAKAFCLAGADVLEAWRIGPSRAGAGTSVARAMRVALGVLVEAGDWNQLRHLWCGDDAGKMLAKSASKREKQTFSASSCLPASL